MFIQINTCRRDYLKVNILGDDILHCLLWVLSFYGSNDLRLLKLLFKPRSTEQGLYKPFKVKCTPCLCSLWLSIRPVCLVMISCQLVSLLTPLPACLFLLSAILSPCHIASLSKELPVWLRDIQPACPSACLSSSLFYPPGHMSMSEY
jgi:hypothetical protein